MPITINGSGTVTGITAGGLPDDCIVTADIADSNVTTPKVSDGAITQAKRSEQLTLGTAQASTSGTSIDFTGIPSWVKRVTVMLDGVSTNGTSAVQIQLGDSGGIETSGYVGNYFVITGSNLCTFQTYTSGFVIIGSSAVETRQGALILTNSSANSWLAIGNFVNGGTGHSGGTQGRKTTSATLDRIRITTINGTDTFDAGLVNIMYE